MAKRLVLLLISAALLIGLMPASVSAEEKNVTIRTQYTKSITIDTSWFDLDSAFNQPTTTYDTTLARASAILAVGTNRKNFDNMKSALQTMGFPQNYIRKYSPTSYEEKYATGFYTAHKSITRNGHAAHVYLVCIGDYANDASAAYDYMNKESGNTAYEQDLVLSYTEEAKRIYGIIKKDYLNEMTNNYYDCIIWVTGYGRGASIGDYLSVLLDNEYGTSHVTSYLFGLSRMDTSYNKSGDSKYYNIYGIKSKDDFNTYLPLGTWKSQDWWGVPVYFGVPSGGNAASLESELNTLYKQYTAKADRTGSVKLADNFSLYSASERNGVKLASMMTNTKNTSSLASIISSYSHYYTGKVKVYRYYDIADATKDKVGLGGAHEDSVVPYALVKEIYSFLMQDPDDTSDSYISAVTNYLFMLLATYKRSTSTCPLSGFVHFVAEYGYGLDDIDWSTILSLLNDPTLTMGRLFTNSIPEIYLMYTSLSDPNAGIINLNELPQNKESPADSMSSGGITIAAEDAFYGDNQFTATATKTTGIGCDIFFGYKNGSACNSYYSVTMTVPRPDGAAKTDVPVMYYPDEILEADKFYHPRYTYDESTDTYQIQLTKLNGSLVFKERLNVPSGRDLTYDGVSHYMVTVDQDWALYTAANHVDTNANTGTAKIGIKNPYRYEWNDSKNTVEEKSVHWSMAKRPFSVSAQNVTVTYDGEAHGANGYTIGGWGLVKDDKGNPIHSISGVTISGEKIHGGIYTDLLVPSGAKITDKDGNDVTANYDITYAAGTLTINRKTIRLPAAVTGEVYDGQPHDLLKTADSSIYVVHEFRFTAAGTADARASFNNTTDYQWPDGTTNDQYIECTLARRPVTITANDVSCTADGKNHGGNGWTVSKTEKNTGLVSGHTLTDLTISGSGIEADSYELIPGGAVIRDAGGKDVTANYEITYEKGTLTLTDPTFGETTYTWNGNQCIAERKCNETDSLNVYEAVMAAYVMDSPAACTAAETGHYIATFTNIVFSAQQTEANSVTNGEPLGHGAWTYSASGAVLTAACGRDTCGHTETAALYISEESITYNGEARTPAAVEYSDGFPDKDLTVSYEDNTDAGTAKASITRSDAKAETSFTIGQAELAKPAFPQAGGKDKTYVYTGGSQTFLPDGFDENTMTITGNIQTNANENGYSVTAAPKDNFKWSTEGDCTFTWIISKAGIDNVKKPLSGSMYPDKGSTVTISLPDLPIGASFGTVSFEGVTDVIGNIDNGKLTLTAAEDLGQNISSFTSLVKVNGGTNYNDDTIAVRVDITQSPIVLSAPVFSAGKVSLSVSTRLQDGTAVLFFAVCYDAQGRMLGASLTDKTMDSSITEVVLDYPSGVRESDVTRWQVTAADAVGLFPLGRAAIVKNTLPD